MHSEVAKVVAEVNLRRQHKFRDGWNLADQTDQDWWEWHDHMSHDMPYGICTVCEYWRKRVLDLKAKAQARVVEVD